MNNNEVQTRWGYKKALKNAGLTQVELAEATGISMAYLSLFGNGKFVLNLLDLKKLARTLKVSEAELLDNDR